MTVVSLQEFHAAGMVWLANRALHPFGYALMVTVVAGDDEDEFRVVEARGLQVVRTNDPLGITFDEETEDRSRERFFAALRQRFAAQKLFGG